MPGFINFEELPTGQAKVANAAWQLMLDHSDCPTSGNIVELGYITSTTSKTTITNGMRQFWRLLSESINTSMHIPNIPIELEQAIFGVYKDLNARAESLLVEKSDDYKKTIENYENDLQEAKQEITTLKHDLTLRQETNEKLICDGDAHTSIIARLNTEVKDLRHERSQLETALKDSRLLNEQLEQRLAAEQIRNDNNIKTERQRFDINDSSLKKRIDDLASEIKSLNSLAATRESKYETQTNKVTIKLENLQDELHTRITNEHNISSKLKETESLLSARNVERDALLGTHKDLDATILKSKQESEDLRIVVAEQTEKVKLLDSTSASLQANNQALLKQLEALTSIIKDGSTKSSTGKQQK